MWSQIKKTLALSLFIAFLGAVVGGIVWGILWIMTLGIDLLWTVLPEVIAFKGYPIVVCGIGGILIGFIQKKFGPYPQEMSEVMAEIKTKGRLPYNNLPMIAVAALLPLIFGGSLGPEAGLTGVIAGLCYWLADRFRGAWSEIDDLASVGIAATLSAIFRAPLFAFANQVESREDEPVVIPKKSKILMYFIAIISGFGIYQLLGHYLGGGMGLGRFANMTMGRNEWLLLIPLALIGVLAGSLNAVFNSMVKKAVAPLQNQKILLAVIGGVALGAVGMLLPYTMFAGEEQMTELMGIWQKIPVIILLLTGVVKLLMGNICLETGWRGGNIFPTIFSGVAIGYAMAMLLPVDPVFSVAVVSAGVTGAIMRKPMAVVMLLMICFPVSAVLPLAAAAVIATAIPEPQLGKKQSV